MALFRKKTTKEDEKKVEDKKVSSKDEKSMKKLYEEESLKKEVTKKKVDSNYKGAYRILIKPLVTEKATDLGSLNKYVFLISDKANKLEVKKAIYSVYGVKPEAVNIVKIEGKRIRRGRITGKRKDIKKAIVSLKAGDSIQVYEGV